jgi:GTP cyclohydrolase I
MGEPEVVSEVNLNDTSCFLSKANSNVELSEEEKQVLIENGAKAFENFLDALGFNWREDHNMMRTPFRFTKAFVEDIARGCYEKEPKITAFPNYEKYDGIVFQGGIPVVSLCSHHLAPFMGRAHVAYIPDDEGAVIGLSKLNRIVEFYSRRPQIQEGLTMQICEAIDKVCTGNKGVAVLVKATHTCVCNRGIKHQGTAMQTARMTGDFLKDASTRSEFYEFVKQMEQK